MSGIGPISETPGFDLFVGPVDPRVAGNALTVAANTAYLMAFSVSAPVVVTQARIMCAVSSGNVDVGVYDTAGTRLGSTGSTAVGAANVAQTINLTAPVTLVPGRRYFAAIVADNATVTFFGVTATSAVQFALSLTATAGASFPLPATISVASAGPRFIAVCFL